MTDALFEVATKEPASCTGDEHTHRWLRFGQAGERDEIHVIVPTNGLVSMSEQAVEVLLREAGFVRADADDVELNWLQRRAWARSRLQDALNRRGR